MSEVLEYKCPGCGAPLVFDADKQVMKCGSCDNNYSVEFLERNENEKEESGKDEITAEWEKYNAESLNADNLKIYSCTSCGAEIIGDETTAATHCMYCDSPAIMVNQLTGAYKPDYVIPFKMGKPDAKEAILKLCKGKKLLPKGFTNENHIEEIKGIYVPFWLFDCDIYANINYRATRVSHWSDRKYNYTRTEHFKLDREGTLDFTKVPIDGSSKIDNIFMEAVEPFDYSEAVDFQTAYLSGFLADKYDVDSEDCKGRVNERIKNSTVSVFADTTKGRNYTTVSPSYVDIKANHGSIRYALLPVWFLNTKYKDKMYTFVMNGQTGKFIGKLPYSIGKLFAWLGGLTAGIFVVISILYTLLRVSGVLI